MPPSDTPGGPLHHASRTINNTTYTQMLVADEQNQQKTPAERAETNIHPCLKSRPSLVAYLGDPPMDPAYGHDPGPGVRPGDIFGSINPSLILNKLALLRYVLLGSVH